MMQVWKGGSTADPWKKTAGKVEDPADALRDSRYTMSSLQWLVEHAEADHVAGQPRQAIWGWCRYHVIYTQPAMSGGRCVLVRCLPSCKQARAMRCLLKALFILVCCMTGCVSRPVTGIGRLPISSG